MNILGIDTSTDNCSAGVVSGGRVVGQNARIGRSMASEQLILLIDTLLQQVDISMDAIDAIAVSIGPGSYTGLRIGLSTAKGLAYARKIPVLPVPTMAVLESAARETIASDMVLMVKSHRDMAYYTFCSRDQQLNIDSIQIDYKPFAVIHQEYKNQYTYVSPSDINDPVFPSVIRCYPGGDHAALIAARHYDLLKSKSTPDLEPLYFSEFEAIKWKSQASSE